MDKVIFYNPHPGRRGWLGDLPREIKREIDKISGKEASLDETLRSLQEIGEPLGCKIANEFKYCYLSCSINRDEGKITDFLLLIQYRPVARK